MKRSEHWNQVYTARRSEELAWFQQEPAVSLDLIDDSGFGVDARILDVGGGDSLLVDRLLARGYREVTVLDVSDAALSRARQRLGDSGRFVSWVASDVTSFVPAQDFDLWHDRAAFHFLTEDDDRESYRRAMTRALRPGAHAILATFSVDGPAKCSGLDVRRYTVESLGRELGRSFELVDSRRHLHTTPGGEVQEFVFGRFVRVAI